MSDEMRNASDEAKKSSMPETESKEESEELRELDRQLGELRAKGIISGGEGPRDSLKPVAHIPGALERFLKSRG